MNKKGALELSMQSIIIFILAIIVLSALVIVIRGMLGNIKTPSVGPDVNNLGRTQATPSTPLTIGPSGSNMDLSQFKKNQPIPFEFFNAGADVSGNLHLKFDTCYSGATAVTDLSSKVAVSSVVLLTGTLKQGSLISDQNFRVDNTGLAAGAYDCIIGIYDSSNKELAKQDVTVNVK